MAQAARRMVRRESGRVAGPGGVELFWREWAPPADRAAAVMLFVHGAGEHSGRYEAFGEYFASRGVPVLAFDLRGLGQSGGPRGHLDRFEDYLGDVMLFRGMVATRHPGAKVVLVGHSMGGLIALAAAAAHGEAFAAVVVSGPLLGLAVKVPGWKAGLGKLLARLAPRTTMTNEIDPALLARNPEVGRRYAADPHVCKKVSAGWFIQVLRAMSATSAAAEKMTIPTFILHGTEDKLVQPDAARAFFERLGPVPKAFRSMEGWYHELFQEDGRVEVFGLIADWLGQLGVA